MIRDPSDGSVKEENSKLSAPDHHPKPLETQVHGAEKPVLSTGTSGLPLESQRASYQEKLERSREWLRQYRTDPESVMRRMGEQGSENV